MNIRIRIFVFLLVMASLGTFCDVTIAQQRTWLDDTGKYEIQAEFVEVIEKDGNEIVILRPPSGAADMEVPMNRLSVADQEHIASLLTKDDPDDPEPVPADPVPAEPAPTDPTPTNPSEAPMPEPTAPVANLNSPVTGTGSTVSTNAAAGNVPNESAEPDGRRVGVPPGQEVVLPKSKTRPKKSPISSDDEPVYLDELERTASGLAKKNPQYLVSVDPNQFRVLGPQIQQIASTLHESDSVVEKEEALFALASQWPEIREPTLIATVINSASAPEKSVRRMAIDLLANHDSDQSLRYILARVDDTSFEVRWRAYELLEELADPRMVPELAKRFSGRDRKKICNVLKVVGSQAEPSVLPYLEHRDRDIVLDTCNLLATIGTEQALPQVDAIANQAATMMLKIQARTTAERIRERIAENENANR